MREIALLLLTWGVGGTHDHLLTTFPKGILNPRLPPSTSFLYTLEEADELMPAVQYGVNSF